jgi:predicted tellurium resistance membrane protein TerC
MMRAHIMDAALFTEPDTYISLLTLTAMEIVLGIDNIVFLSILTAKLPRAQQPKARSIGLTLALVSRLGLLFAISWVMGLTRPLFEVFGESFSGRDLILLSGGLFLVGKATFEIHDKLEAPSDEASAATRTGATFAAVLVQVMLLDVVFSLDSVITAVGMAKHVPVMVAAMVIAVGVMLVSAGTISDFVERNPTLKILALSFLILIGVMLTVEGMGQHVSKGYIYFAMAFSLVVELLNMRMRKHAGAPIELHSRFKAPVDVDLPPDI